MARKGGKDRGIVEKPKGSGKWWVRLYVNGREQRHRCDNKTQAKNLYDRLKVEQREGRLFPERYRARHQLTVKQWIDRCLDGSTNRDSKHEKQRAKYWADLWGSRPLSGITSEDLRHQQAKMVNSGDFQPATINRYFSALRRVLTLAVQDGRLNRNPMKGVKFLPEPQKDRFFSDDELLRIRALMTPKDWALVHFSVETCLRRSEQFGLRWQDVNFEAKAVTIPLPKGKRTRRVPLSDEALTILRSLDLLTPFVFSDPMEPLKPRQGDLVADHFKRILRKTGINDASWHTLRHTGASRRLLAGVDIVTVSKILGHSTIQTTMRYLHLVRSHLHEAINKGSIAAEETRNGTGSKTGTKEVPSAM
jgi:integrase